MTMPRRSRSSSGSVTGISPVSGPGRVLLALQGYRDREVEVGEQADRGPAVPGPPADHLPGVQAAACLLSW